MRRALLLSTAISAAVASIPARADPPSPVKVRLSYRPAPGCPDEKALRYGIGARMSIDPFDPQARAQLTVTVKRTGDIYTGVAELREPGPAKPWVRPLPPASSCEEMIDALGFVIAVHIDPGGPPPPRPAPALQAPPPQLEAPLSPPPRAPSRSLRLGLGAAMGLGVSPAAAAPGVTLDVGIRWLRWAPLSLALEGRAYPTATGGAENGAARVTSGRYTGALVPCAHWRANSPLELAGCALLELGALRVTSDAAYPEPAIFFYAATGLRGAIEVPVTARLALRATGDTLFALRRYRARIDDSPVWETPLVSGGLGLGVVASF